MLKFSILFLLLLFSMFTSCEPASETNNMVERVQPYSENPRYWEYQGEPVLLLGGSAEDNLFNHPGLEPGGLETHLDLLVESGGNYLRNTMSARNPGNRYPFRRLENGLYDLTQWDERYWNRFEDYLDMTRERDIIIQLEFWDPWDMYRSEGEGMTDFRQGNTGWESHPFNPDNNINYDTEDSDLPVAIDYFPGAEPTSHSFFHSVPDMENNELVLQYQQAFIDRVLSYTLRYPHIIYCINNETGEDVLWGDYWIRYILEKANKEGVEIYATDMRRNEHINGPDHRYIHNRPDLYTFVEISQNNGQTVSGQQHWDEIIELRAYLADNPRPMNNNKIYGGPDGWGGEDEGLQKFWRNIFAGSASARFHRPPAGHGLNELARNHLESMRMIEERVNIFSSLPSNDLLSGREENEAYLLAEQGVSYAIYFPNEGSVELDLSDAEGEFLVSWLNIQQNEWTTENHAEGGEPLLLETPGIGHQAAVIIRQSP
ncbi:MAG: hypothetical protein WD604_16565 [Balneolaceae bacterium]